MLKMKLLLNASQGEPADQAHQRLPRAVSPSAGPHSPAPSQLDKETVFEWFGLRLEPAQRLELMCGLLHMCQPLELRFLGSYLEDLARKDYHVLRDFESRANSLSDLGSLTDVRDPVVRSKLLVCLSLLGSDSRDCAGVLFQSLSRVDPAQVYNTPDYCLAPFGLPQCESGSGGPVEGAPEQNGLTPCEAAAAPLEQLALLFTMASLHPAFHFHQRQMLRGQLDKIQLTAEEQRRQSVLWRTAQPLELPARGEDHAAPHAPCLSLRCNRGATEKEAVHIERIVLRGISRTKVGREYNFEVTWSDLSCSSVTKSHLELEKFLLKLPKDQCIKSFERGLHQLLKQGEQFENKNMEENLRDHFLSAPPVFTQSRKVWCFFSSDCDRCPASGSPQVYHRHCSDGSSQDEDFFVQDHKKKHRNKSPSSLSGPSESPEEGLKHEECESRGHTQMPRGKGKTKGTPNGSFVAAFQWKDVASGCDTLGESSSERSSCASSPQHRGTDSLDSEEDQYRASTTSTREHVQPFSHLDTSTEGLGPDPSFSNSLHAQMEPSRTDCTDISGPSFMPFVLPTEAPSLLKPGPGAVRMHIPPAMTGSGLMIEPEKRDILPTFGISSINLPPPGSPAIQPLVQRFKTLSHGASGSTSTPPTAPPAPLPTPIRAISIMSTSLTSFSSNLQPSLPCQDLSTVGSVPLVETSHTTLPALNLPYPLPPTPPSVMAGVGAAATAAAPVQGILQAAVPPAVPTHTPGPAPSSSPALTHSMAHSDCTSYRHNSESCGDGPGQQALSCGMCGCQCGAGTGSAPPMFFHQMSVPHLFPLTNYLPQAQAAPQANGTTLSPIYPSGAPYGPLHSHADMLGLQQQMAPSFCQRLYPQPYPQPYPNPVGLLATAALGGGLNKKNGSVSCSNCGVSGHYTHDCNQPSIDSTQQGGFRLKYTASHISEALDKAEGAG